MLRAAGIALLLIVSAAGGFLGYRYWRAASEPAGAESAAVTVAPEFSLPDLDGKVQSIAQWKGKVLLVNFWATWCEPCLREIPLLEQIQKEYADRGVQVIGVAIDDPAEVRQFMTDSVAIDYPVLVGEQEAVDALAGFGAEMTVLPYTAFVARDGRIAQLHAGELHREEATAVLAPLL